LALSLGEAEIRRRRAYLESTLTLTRRPYLDRVGNALVRKTAVVSKAVEVIITGPRFKPLSALSLVFLRVRQSQIERSGNDPSETDTTVFVLDKRG
jgi:hypothetical protein